MSKHHRFFEQFLDHHNLQMSIELWEEKQLTPRLSQLLFPTKPVWVFLLLYPSNAAFRLPRRSRRAVVGISQRDTAKEFHPLHEIFTYKSIDFFFDF